MQQSQHGTRCILRGSFSNLIPPQGKPCYYHGSTQTCTSYVQALEGVRIQWASLLSNLPMPCTGSTPLLSTALFHPLLTFLPIPVWSNQWQWRSTLSHHVDPAAHHLWFRVCLLHLFWRRKQPIGLGHKSLTFFFASHSFPYDRRFVQSIHICYSIDLRMKTSSLNLRWKKKSRFLAFKSQFFFHFENAIIPPSQCYCNCYGGRDVTWLFPVTLVMTSESDKRLYDFICKIAFLRTKYPTPSIYNHF